MCNQCANHNVYTYDSDSSSSSSADFSESKYYAYKHNRNVDYSSDSSESSESDSSSCQIGPCKRKKYRTCVNCVPQCVYDCSPPLWQTWPRIKIRQCVGPCPCYGCGYPPNH